MSPQSGPDLPSLTSKDGSDTNPFFVVGGLFRELPHYHISENTSHRLGDRTKFMTRMTCVCNSCVQLQSDLEQFVALFVNLLHTLVFSCSNPSHHTREIERKADIIRDTYVASASVRGRQTPEIFLPWVLSQGTRRRTKELL